MIIYTDHANLTYYRHPHKLSKRARRALNCTIKYNITIKHKPSIQNWADALSKCPDYPKHIPAIDEIGLPNQLFIHTASALDLDDSILKEQTQHPDDITQLFEWYPSPPRRTAGPSLTVSLLWEMTVLREGNLPLQQFPNTWTPWRMQNTHHDSL